MTSNRIEELTRKLGYHRQLGTLFKRIFESIPDGVIFADREERIIMVNPSVESMIGYREKELVGRSAHCLFESRPESQEQDDSERLNRDSCPVPQSQEVCLKKKSGTIFTAETVKTEVRGESGELLCSLMLIRDIARRKKLEDSLRNLDVKFRIVRPDGKVRWIEHACQPAVSESGDLLGFRSSNRDITNRKNYEQELHGALAEIEQYKEQLEAESAYLQEEMRLSLNYENIIGSSNAMQYVFFKIEQISTSDATVLLLGETGTGKELFARAIHNTSRRKDRPLVKVNCASLPRDLIDSELFGHEKGAFTSADRKHIGRFELAHRGTIFLDEIGDLHLDLQSKLLRVLQEGEFQRVGNSNTTRIDVRVIAATNRNLKLDVSDGLFRKDLWYRLNIFPITAPPLRDRLEDIPQLVRYFIDRFGCRQGKNITTIPAGVMRRLENYSWPGNVRELENVIERAVINTLGSTLTLADELKPLPGRADRDFLTLEDLERRYITEVLEKTNWKVSGQNSAAEILGLKRSTLRAKISKYNIRKP